ncbi:MAG TPA: lamin tail domain-containing protein, partial [Clostridia bacterium]|nr:lamin tail domain-containing protein [Clostridia bacterium]
MGASIAGEPVGTNNQTTATLIVGVARSGYGIPTDSWPNGAGYTHYKWRLDSGAWSAETPTTTPITLTGLSNGPHYVEVIGKRDSGWYQDAVEFGPNALVTTSKTWVVDTSYVPVFKPSIRINEVLAQNVATLTNGTATPDLIELHNYGSAPVDLVGMGLTDNAAIPHKFVFPAGTPQLGPNQYLVLYADNQTTAPGIHLGFSLKANGDDLHLYDKVSKGGALLDSVVYGIQVSDLSIGRALDGTWVLSKPTFGTNNIAVLLGAQRKLRINEWLADELFLANNDFVELFNPDSFPVALGGCYLSDAEGVLGLHQIPALSFIGAKNYVSFVADGNSSQGADHLSFKLDPEIGIIVLSDSGLNLIDVINYGPQRTDVSQGRSPNGGDTLSSFAQPTAGGPNPSPNGGITSVTNITAQVVKLLDITNTWKYENSGTNLPATWPQLSYDDADWASGEALFGYETTPAAYPFPFSTPILPPDQPGGHVTVYFRARFSWDQSLTNFVLVSTNYVDDGAVYYLNGSKVASLRMPASFTYSTLATNQPNEGRPEVLFFSPTNLVSGSNVMAVEVHQGSTGSSDVAFGCQLNAVQFTTNIITSTNTGVPVVINEVLASNQTLTNKNGTTSDWVELFNLSSEPVDISGLSLTDDPNVPHKFVFAAGSLIAGGDSLLVYCDNNQPAATNSAGFSLNASGGSLFLFDRAASGGGMLDAISFGLQVADYSIGRMPNGLGTWTLNMPTPASANASAGLGNVASLTVNEWMADPSSGSDWFELYNSGEQPVSLGGLYFTDDLSKPTLSPVAPLSFIGTGANGFIKFQADGNLNAGADHVKFALSKSGETIGLYSPAGILITAVRFEGQKPGVSQGHFPDGSTNTVDFSLTSSPGESNYLPLPQVVINEVLTHTDLPLEDAVEFYNAGDTSLDIGGWFLSNSQEDLKKFRIADGTMIAPRKFIVFYEYQFNSTNGSSTPFTLNSAHGDKVFLSEADPSGNLTGYRATALVGAAANSVSFGRYTNSLGEVDYVATSALSFGVSNPSNVQQFRKGVGALNPDPLVGPVVINELMFYPPFLSGLEDDTVDEYIELVNTTLNSIPLYDPSAPTNTWRIKGGVDYSFPSNTTLPANGIVLVVNFDPVNDPIALNSFRTRYHLDSAVQLYGPYGGNLANNGENVALYRPDPPQVAPHPDAGFVPYVLVERVNYLANAPWPTGAAGSGASLQRQVVSNYGNEPANWFVDAPTPSL